MTEPAADPPPDVQPVNAGGGAAHSEALNDWLLNLRRRAKLLLVGRSIAWVVGCVIAAVLVGGILDYFLRAPAWLRTIGLLGAWGTLAAAVARLVLPALSFAPSLTEVALRVERASAGNSAGLTNTLASAVDLARVQGADAALVGPVIAQARSRTATVKSGSLLAPGSALRAGVWAGVWLVIACVVIAAAPMEAMTGAARMLWPWGGAEWPKRTAIADVTQLKTHPQGSALALRAALTRSERAPQNVRISANYRLIDAGRSGAWKTVVLTDQSRSVNVPNPRSPDERQGVLFERLLEPTGLRPERIKDAPSGPLELEYTLFSDDDQTQTTRVLLVEPPRVLSAEAVVTPPAYAERLGLSQATTTLELGPGTDERANAPAMLSGSAVTLVLHLNKNVPGPKSASGNEKTLWISRSLGQDAARLLDGDPAGASLAVDGATWTLKWTLADALRVVVRPVDEYGVAASEDAAYRLDALKDNPPTASVITPAEDRSVLATAAVELVGEARDDVGLDNATLERQIARKPAGSEGGKPEATEPAVEFARTSHGEQASKTLKVASKLELSTLKLNPGDEVWITAVATDAYELDGQRHAPVRSSVRKLRILSRDELIEQVWSELGEVRRAAIRIDQEQIEAKQQSARPGEDAARRAERSQAGISERLSRQAQSLSRLSERLKENALSDQTLRDVMQEADRSVGDAGKKSVEASQSLSEAGKAQAEDKSGDPKTGQQQRDKAAQQQEAVRDELAKLIDLLDRGEDTFASKRAVERLLSQQKSLRERTASAASTSAGKSPEQLSPQERQALSQIAQEQKSAAEQLSDAVEKMSQREQKLRQNDPAAAQAMAQAARRAQREQTQQKMQQAAQQVQQNQTGSAQQQQQAAEQTLEQMLKDIEQTSANRDEVLRRQLASLIESIDALIIKQEANLKLLDERGAGGSLDGLDLGMAQLHQNTLGVLDQAERGPRELRPIGAILEKAADAQARSVTQLRAGASKVRDARVSEQESLDKLQEAKAEAEKLDKQAEERQAQRQRGELRKKYQEALERQLSIKSGSQALSEQEQSRRTRAEARQLGEDQSTLKGELNEFQKQTKELSDAKVFDYAHRRLDSLMTEASDELAQGNATALVVSRQASAARVLKALVDALDDRKQKNKPFREGSSGGNSGGGNGRQPLLPPATEVALLRDLQIEAAELTRSGAEEPAKHAELIKQAAQLQGELAKQAADLLKRITEEATGGPQSMPKIEPKTEPKVDEPGKPNEPAGGAG